MVTKPTSFTAFTTQRSVLAKIFMVTKQRGTRICGLERSVLAKIFMVTKPHFVSI